MQDDTESGDRTRLRCWHCQDVIGVYEPIVLETEQGARETSLLAEPSLNVTTRRCFHRACYGQDA
jgi:hypothetical protein